MRGFTSIASVIFAIYTLIFAVLWKRISVPKLPEDPSVFGLNFTQAYQDLYQIASRPHPYNSHANDEVRLYLLKRLREVTEGHAHIEIDDDQSSKATWVRGKEAISFEGLNILVKVKGTEEEFGEKEGVLFSAHFDSVSSGPGVTDDAISIVSLLAFLEYLTTHRVKRTAVFNFNNGEEDGLNGAHAFLEHPWSTIPHKLLNLEGAGAGGRPLLFRSTSLSPVRNYISPQPHGSIITADAFLRGVVRSGTDFTVYMNGQGMEGLDIAFYEGRAWYHTMHDSLRGAGGARESLWAMMRTVKDTGLAMLNEEAVEREGAQAVYFDVFGKWFVVSTQQAMLRFSVALMVLGPLVLWAIAKFVPREANAVPVRAMRRTQAGSTYKLWIPFWASFLLSLVAQALLVFAILKLNPYIVHSHPYTLLISTFSLVYLTTVGLLRTVHLGSDRKTLGLQLYVLTYLLNGAGTYTLHKFEIGGVFPFMTWHFCTFLGCAVGYLGKRGDEGTVVVRTSRIPESTEKAERKRKSLNAAEETPLLTMGKRKLVLERVQDGTPWWLIQALMSIPVPVTLLMQILLLFLAALGQTLSDGSSPVFIYAAAALLSAFIILPIVPFTSSIHRNVTMYALLAFILSTTFNLTTFPFNTDAPMKVFFQQRVQVLPQDGIRAITALTGVPYYLDKLVIPELPSTWGKNVSRELDKDRSRTWTCLWESDMLPSAGPDTALAGIGSNIPLTFNATSLSSSSALVRLSGVNTRSCRVYFDNRKVTQYDVYELSSSGSFIRSDRKVQSGYDIPAGGISALRLYSRSRKHEFVVNVRWEPEEQEERGLKGRVACEWSEYESATREMKWAELGGKIPAFEEMLESLPRWAVVTKLKDGLVEVWSDFEV
ncbi:hypothetical protein BDQ17DRAFT_1252051 [Cyathus striatus]|nr:hypothetical protein BDQ17DRAFT_1252051 [Cyathus striatus]